MSAIAEHPVSTETPFRGRIVVEPAPSAAVDQETPMASRREPIEFLDDQVQMGATIASLLVHNFGGDGSCRTPSEAPGLYGMVTALATVAAAAHALAIEQQEKTVLPLIFQASSLADHMAMLADAELYHGARGFRLGDGLLCMSFWTIEKLLEKAHEELNA